MGSWKLVGKRWVHQEAFDVETANELLKYAISVLRGSSGMVATEKGKLEVALILKKDLARMGAWYQVKVLDHWIHRFQGGEFRRVLQ